MIFAALRVQAWEKPIRILAPTPKTTADRANYSVRKTLIARNSQGLFLESPTKAPYPGNAPSTPAGIRPEMIRDGKARQEGRAFTFSKFQMESWAGPESSSGNAKEKCSTDSPGRFQYWYGVRYPQCQPERLLAAEPAPYSFTLSCSDTGEHTRWTYPPNPFERPNSPTFRLDAHTSAGARRGHARNAVKHNGPDQGCVIPARKCRPGASNQCLSLLKQQTVTKQLPAFDCTPHLRGEKSPQAWITIKHRHSETNRQATRYYAKAQDPQAAHAVEPWKGSYSAREALYQIAPESSSSKRSGDPIVWN